MARLKDEYNSKIRKELLQEGEFSNIMEVPRLEKIVVNTGVSDATNNSAAIEEASEIITDITGQKPVVARAKKSVSSFKVREGMDIGVFATLRGDRMWEFFDKLVNVVFPRTRDFRGVSLRAFDGSGNYTLGVTEHTVFPEINPNKVQKLRGLQITIVTTAKNNEQAKMFLDKFGFPFKKDGKKV
ncbi:50S ribosomal protein L5 [Candidatus Dojkabacteria bacterium]|uniref:Large ribosomal subunit protein uL5 n=1 Tax=Candidatus Dojkabacteria bacterium TaxID=2099670 RepID=A0A955KV30_9BACT|nr:50S ribosomal protein L5 [Candidatus Dojkabacteria bacterium]